MATSNVWGSGGLFEQALASKMDRQASETALTNSRVGVDAFNADTSRMQADTNLLETKNRYDLGLRTAGTNQFIADTQRLSSAPASLITDTVANNLGLRSYNPVSQQAATDFGLKFGGADLFKKPGMKNGGMVVDPKKMAMHGAPAGGKIKTPKGYAKGGKIGNVSNDTGADTVDVKARPGEYFLNPETVTHIGGGDYSQGVRQLNQIVREATGKEPGPSPVGKSGKPGFAAGGTHWIGGPDGLTRADPRLPAVIPGESARIVTPPSTALTVIPQQPAGAGAAAAEAAADTRSAWQKFTDPKAWAERGAAARPAAQAVADTAGKARAMLPEGKLGLAGSVVGPLVVGASALNDVNAKKGFYDDPNVGTFDKLGQWIRDVKNPVAGYVGGTVGAGLGSGLASIPLAAAGAAGGVGLAKWWDDEGEAYQKWSARNKEQQAAAQAQAQAKAAPAAAPAEAKPEEAKAEAPKEPSLRDMMLTRLKNIDQVAATNGGLGSQYWNNARGETVNALTQLDNTATQQSTAMIKARQDMQDKTDERIQKNLFTFPTFDKDGKRNGTSADTEMANDFRTFLAENPPVVNGKAVDFYSLPNSVQDDFARQFSIVHQTNRNFNNKVRDGGGTSARTSNSPSALQIKNGLSLGDVMSYKGVTMGDWVRSLNPFSDATDNMVAISPGSGPEDKGEAVPLIDAIRTPEGNIDRNQLNAVRRQDASLREMMQKLAQQQPKK